MSDSEKLVLPIKETCAQEVKYIQRKLVQRKNEFPRIINSPWLHWRPFNQILLFETSFNPWRKDKSTSTGDRFQVCERRTNSFMTVVSNVAQMIVMVGDVNCRGSTDPQTQKEKRFPCLLTGVNVMSLSPPDASQGSAKALIKFIRTS